MSILETRWISWWGLGLWESEFESVVILGIRCSNIGPPVAPALILMCLLLTLVAVLMAALFIIGKIGLLCLISTQNYSLGQFPDVCIFLLGERRPGFSLWFLFRFPQTNLNLWGRYFGKWLIPVGRILMERWHLGV